MTKKDDAEEHVHFDIEDFFDQLMGKLERAKAKGLKPIVKEEPLWVFALPEEIKDEQAKDVFTMMVKREGEELELHYGNTADGQFYMVSFTGVTKDGFVKSVREIMNHVYGDLA